MMRWLVYRRAVMSRLIKVVDFLMFELLFAGGTVFWLVEMFYNSTFEILQRMKRTKEQQHQDKLCGAPDWENPRVVGRNRRAPHAPLHGFASKAASIEYWLKGAPPDRAHLTENVMLLTGRAGTPQHTGWTFCLVGDPDKTPEQWNMPGYQELPGEWTAVALPAHWQLQGFDIPIYTNTTYPFAFDPPRARRQGKWHVTDCDLGLGASSATCAPLHPKEPGENPTGLYRRKFTLPANWLEGEGAGSRVFLCFEGADAALSVWLDGSFVGYSQDSCLPAEFDVTKALGKGAASETHCLAVQVLRWCDGSYLEDQDKWWLSGLYREVLLLRKPRIFLADYEFSADVSSAAILRQAATGLSAEDLHMKELEVRVRRNMCNDACEKRKAGATENGTEKEGGGGGIEEEVAESPTSGTVTISVVVEGQLGMGEEWWVRADMHLTETHGTARAEAPPPLLTLGAPVHFPGDLPRRAQADTVCDLYESDAPPPMPKGYLRGVCMLTVIMPYPLLWSAEMPHLYTFVLSLHASEAEAELDAAPRDVESFRAGFRDIRLLAPHNIIGVNGAAITVAGINRHEFCPQQGRAVSLEAMRRDAAILKQLNFNSVRCSHYPPHPHWLDVCDEVGMQVVDEANLETHGFQAMGQAVGYLAALPEWRGAIISRVSRMVERDKNHASVLFWSLGNEAGVGPAQELMAAWVRTRDPRRLLQYESGGARSLVTDVICPMYQRVSWCRWQATEDPQQRPVVLCEYAHAMGNSGGCMVAYWREFRNVGVPRFQGGFIWDLVDQGLALPPAEGPCKESLVGGGRFGYGGDFGDVPHTGNFCCNGILAPDRSLHPSASEAWFLQSPISLSLRQFQAVRTEGNKGDKRLAVALDNLCIAVENRFAHVDLSGIDVLVALRCDGSPSQAVSPPAVLPCDPMVPLALPEYPFCRLRGEDLHLGPGAMQGVPLPSAVPAVAVMLACIAKPRTAEPMTAATTLAAALSVTLDQLSRISECWFEVWAVQRAASDSCPQNFVILRTSLSHTVLNEALATFLLCCALDRQAAQALKPIPTALQYSVSFVEPADPLLIAPGEVEVIRIEWADGAFATVGVCCGRLLAWEAAGQTMLVEPLDACLWRAPTDNDQGGGMLSYAAQWACYGLGDLRRQCGEDPHTCSIASCSAQTDGSVVIEAEWTLEPAPVQSGPTPLHCEIHCRMIYTFLPCGAIFVAAIVAAPSHLPPLPRTGLQLGIPGRLERVEWVGLGPYEGYADRNACCRLGRFAAPVEALHTPYIRPQECGHRLAPRWFAATVAEGLTNAGLCVIPYCTRTERADASRLSSWGFNASRYSTSQLQQTSHQHLLPEPFAPLCPCVWLHIDSAHMGVGGYDSWTPNVEADALIECGPVRVTDVLLVPMRGAPPQDIYHRFVRGDFGSLSVDAGEK